MTPDAPTERLRRALTSEQRRQQTGGLSELADVAESNPKTVIDLIPLVATYLDDETKSVRQDATRALGHVADEYPAQVKPAVPKLTEAIEAGDIPIGAMFALGQVAKSYPHVGKPLIDTYVELLDDDRHRVRNNALASLADLADEYQDDLRRDTERYIELLDTEDERVRYNATSVLVRIAREYPTAVEPAIPHLRELLTVDHTLTRENACWALGHLRAEEARDDLERVLETETDESVRDAAEYAIDRLGECRRD